MAHSATKIYGNVEIPADIAAVLHVAGTDLETNCKLDDINKWARHKPEGAASGLQVMPLGQISLAERRLNGFGLRINYNAGYGSISMLVTDLRLDRVSDIIEYIKPSGSATSPYRDTDFSGYYHEAHVPIWAPYNPTDTLRVNGDGTLQLYYYVNVNGSDEELGLADLRFTQDDKTFADYYFGILIWDGSSYYAATQDHVMGDTWQEGLDVTLTGVPVPSGSTTRIYNMIPFFSTLPIASQSASFVGTIFPFIFAQSEIRVASAASLVAISVWVYVWDDDMSKIYLRWAVSNRRSAAFNLVISSSDSYVTVGTPQQQGTYGYWGINVSESIPAESSQTGDVLIASNLLAAQQEFIRNGDSYVQVNINRPNAPYFYSGIIQIWESE